MTGGMHARSICAGPRPVKMAEGAALLQPFWQLRNSPPATRAVHVNDLQLLLAHFVHCGVLQVGESSEHQVVVGQLTTHTGRCVYKVGFDGCEVKVARLCLTPDVAALSTLPL